MDKKNNNLWSQLQIRSFIPGFIILGVIILTGLLFPEQFFEKLTQLVNWLMDSFKWLYIVCAVLVTGVMIFLLFSKYGNIRLGGEDAKPSLSRRTWCFLSLTSTIAVGICFYGVSGPVNLFMNPPEFLGVQGGTKEAVIPTLKYCFLHYGLPPYFLMIGFAIMIALMKYNAGRSMRLSDTLYPLLGEKVNGGIGTVIDSLTAVCLLMVGTNMGLAVIQLNAGIGMAANIRNPHFETFIIIGYTLLTIVFACSGVHKLMGKLSTFNAMGYFAVLIFILLVGPTNRLINLAITSIAEFFWSFIPMMTYGDPVYNTSWQTSNTIYYYSWNIAPAVLHAMFYVTISYGRKLKEFVLYNCVIGALITMVWYVIFGGSAIFGILNGSDLYEQMQLHGSGIATFAFLDTLPLGGILKYVFIVIAILSFLTFSDGIAYSFPLLLMKETETDISQTKAPKILHALVGLLMGVLTWMLLNIGGYDALDTMMVALAFPAAILMILVMISFIKAIRNREKYDVTLKRGQKEEEAET